MRKTVLFALLSFVLLFGVISCGDSTSPEKGTITGTISLEGETANSGISVAIYTAGIVPEKVKGINQEYPQVAFPVTDQILFDHRDYSSVASSITDTGGNFSLTDLPYGEYILCYSKEGWGYNYVFGLVLNQAELNITSRGLKLYPEQLVPNFIDGSFIFQTGKCYVANNNVVFGENAQIEMQSDARILLGQNVKISSLGGISLPSGQNWVHITSLTGIYTSNIIPSQIADGLSVIGGSGYWHNISFSYMQDAIVIGHANVDICNITLRACMFGLSATATSDISITKCAFMDNQDTNGSACYIYSVNELSLDKCLFYNNNVALRHEIVKRAVVENNAFIDNNRGFLNLWESTALFQNNEVSCDGVGLENSGKSNLEIYYNNIQAQTCISLYHTTNWYNLPDLGWTKGNYNNLLPSHYSIQAAARYYNNGQPYPLNFSNNYFGTTSQDNIDSFIYDVNDFPEPFVGSDGAIVIYLPYRMAKVVNAGIQLR